MKLAHQLAIFPFLVSLAAAQEPVDTAASPVAGFQEFDCQGSADTVISVPFERSVAFRGNAAAVAPGTSNARSLVITLAGGDPGWNADALAGTHFIRFSNGNAAGRQFPVAGNSGAEIEIEIPEGHPPLNAEAGDPVDIVPFWTPASLFPVATQATLHPSGGLLPGQRGSELFVYPAGPVAPNASPDRVFFLTSTGWFEAAAGIPAADDAVIPPHAVLVIRHPDGADATIFRPAALVNASPSGVVLESRRGDTLDHHLSLSRPLPSTLGELNFLPREFAPSPGLAPAQRRDLLLVFSNAVPTHDPEPAATYFVKGGEWFRVEETGPPVAAAGDSLPAGASFVIRKAPTLNHQTTVWTQDPNL
ncbi:MAG: TIGR02597 family protein [Verrucomicrobiae bacterium]|nr:TIGR02597 family protein [Verrucomicrobiae bacterium]